uniref:Uncharacterized protein n=1 Tax=Populus davidiana TaxID=266767 RepID=A0A6M2E6V9_9ROSI
MNTKNQENITREKEKRKRKLLLEYFGVLPTSPCSAASLLTHDNSHGLLMQESWTRFLYYIMLRDISYVTFLDACIIREDRSSPCSRSADSETHHLVNTW